MNTDNDTNNYDVQLGNAFPRMDDGRSFIVAMGKAINVAMVTHSSKRERGILSMTCKQYGGYRDRRANEKTAATNEKKEAKEESEGKNAHQRDTIKNYCNCFYQFKRRKPDSQWVLEKMHNEHNHPLAMSLSTYAAHRKMNDEQLELALQLVEQNATNKVIVDTINARFPEIQTVAKDISNIRRRFDGLTYSDSKDMRKFIIKLESAGYHIAYDVDKGHVTSFFFTQDNCIQRARRLSEVLVIDATYKTNIYKLPLVNIVGVNNVGLDRHRLATFAVAGAWISNEKTDSYTWIIQKLSEMVYENGHSTVLPNVIVSDNEQALINAINAVFPSATTFFASFMYIVISRSTWRSISMNPERISGLKSNLLYNRCTSHSIGPILMLF